MTTLSLQPMPPTMPMDDYVAFVERLFRAQAPDRVRRQKNIEERIERAFDMAVQEAPPLPLIRPDAV